MPGETIEVVFKPVAANGWHETLVHTARDGHQEFASAYASSTIPAGNSASDETHALWRRSAGLSNEVGADVASRHLAAQTSQVPQPRPPTLRA